MSGIDKDVIQEIFDRIGKNLTQNTTLCLIESSPGLALGQLDRQTADIDVWAERSDFDATDLREACLHNGISFNPMGEIDPGKIYLRIIRPGIVRLPQDFDPEVIGRFGRLTVVMPPPEYIAAAKLVRGTEIDVDDVVWWVRHRDLAVSDIEQAIKQFPSVQDQEAAMENIVFVEISSPRSLRR